MGKKLILIADDDPDVRESLKLMLEMTGHELVFAANGEEVLEKIGERVPDLLILDLLMPKMDGFEVIKRLKKDVQFSNLKQASERRYELETGLSLDVDDYIEKPVNPKDFIHRVEKILKRS